MKKFPFKMPTSAHYDFGIRQLWPEWKQIFSLKYLKDDINAGISVACIALPLSLAIALASGMSPEVGLVTAIIAGIICALFGGSPLSIGGPSVAMAIVVMAIVSEYGISGLIVGVFCSGIIQILSGFFGVVKFLRYIPLPVVAGFTAGIGAIILIGQIPVAIGLSTTDNLHVFNIITHIFNDFSQINSRSIFLSLLTLSIVFLLPLRYPKLPAFLVALIIPTFLAFFLNLNVASIGDIKNYIPSPHWPVFSVSLIEKSYSAIFLLFFLSSMQTLLSTTAMEKIRKGKPHDLNQELIGQGLGNMLSALFGGLPVSNVIARFALNHQSGGKTRRAAIIHALFLLLVLCFSGFFIKIIPLSVLAGILIAIALRRLHPAEFFMLWKNSRLESYAYLITLLSIVIFNLSVGINIGILSSLAIVTLKLSRLDMKVQKNLKSGPIEVTLDGALTFLSGGKIRNIQQMITESNLKEGLIIDLSNLTYIDSSGSELLFKALGQLIELKVTFVIKGLQSSVSEPLFALDKEQILQQHLVYDESEVKEFFAPRENPIGMSRLVEGAQKFSKEIANNYHSLMNKLADKQDPHTLFIACADSRVDTNLITSTSLGELFTIRNVGNIIPPYGSHASSAEGAAIEFALGKLDIKDIVICGHSGCGAMAAILADSPSNRFKQIAEFPYLSKWLTLAHDVRLKMPYEISVNKAVELNILLQLENLKTYPIVQKKLLANEINLHGWYYNIANGELKEWDEVQHVFAEMGTQNARKMQNNMSAGIQLQSLILTSKEKNNFRKK